MADKSTIVQSVLLAASITGDSSLADRMLADSETRSAGAFDYSDDGASVLERANRVNHMFKDAVSSDSEVSDYVKQVTDKLCNSDGFRHRITASSAASPSGNGLLRFGGLPQIEWDRQTLESIIQELDEELYGLDLRGMSDPMGLLQMVLDVCPGWQPQELSFSDIEMELPGWFADLEGLNSLSMPYVSSVNGWDNLPEVGFFLNLNGCNIDDVVVDRAFGSTAKAIHLAYTNVSRLPSEKNGDLFQLRVDNTPLVGDGALLSQCMELLNDSVASSLTFYNDLDYEFDERWSWPADVVKGSFDSNYSGALWMSAPFPTYMYKEKKPNLAKFAEALGKLATLNTTLFIFREAGPRHDIKLLLPDLPTLLTGDYSSYTPGDQNSIESHQTETDLHAIRFSMPEDETPHDYEIILPSQDVETIYFKLTSDDIYNGFEGELRNKLEQFQNSKKPGTMEKYIQIDKYMKIMAATIPEVQADVVQTQLEFFLAPQPDNMDGVKHKDAYDLIPPEYKTAYRIYSSNRKMLAEKLEFFLNNAEGRQPLIQDRKPPDQEEKQRQKSRRTAAETVEQQGILYGQYGVVSTALMSNQDIIDNKLDAVKFSNAIGKGQTLDPARKTSKPKS